MKKIIFLAALSLLACDQGLNIINGSPSSISRRVKALNYPDGHYDLYFRNGAHVHNDCDGYQSEPHGKTIIDEYWQSDIKKWDKLLTNAGVPHQTYKTSQVGKYCNVTFDSDLLYGIGFEGRGFHNNGEDESGQFDILTKTGKLLTFGGGKSHCITGAYFAPAHGKFYFDRITQKEAEKVFNKEQADCDHAKLLIELENVKYKTKAEMERIAKELKDAGANVIGTKIIPGIFFNDYYVVVAPSSIDWFAIGR